MGRPINSFNFGGGFNISAQEPIDSRLVVATQADLTTEETWSGVGLYNGLVVAVQATGQLFVLKDRDNATSASSWVAVGGDVSADLNELSQTVNTLSATVEGIENTTYALETVAVGTNEVGEPLYAKVYSFVKRYTDADGIHEVNLGEINIPKDMVVESGTVVVGDDGKQDIVLTLANGAGDIKIDAENLVDVYTVAADSTKYITISNNEFSFNAEALRTEFGISGLEAAISSAVSDIATNSSAIYEVIATQEVMAADISANASEIVSLKDAIASITHPVYDITINDVAFTKEDNAYSVTLDATSIAVGQDITYSKQNEDGSTEAVIAYGQDDTLSSILEDIDSRLRQFSADLDSATAGGINSINPGEGIAVTSNGVNDRTIAIALSDEANNRATIKDKKLYVQPMTWDKL